MKELLNNRLSQVTESLIRKFSETAIGTYGAKHVLTLGEPDFDTPQVMKEAAIQALNEGKTYYGTTYGNKDFREAIQKFEARMNKVDYDISEIMVTTGSTEGLTSVLMTLLNPGDEVINLIPAYPLYENIVTFVGGKTVNIDTSKTNFQVTKEDLENAISEKTKAIVITSPNNPTGAILSDESLEIIYEAVKKHKFFVISDEVYNQLIYNERRLGFSKYQDIRDYIIVCQSLSKPYAMTGWRLGYVLGPLWFIEEALKIHQYMVVAVNTFIQDGGIVALDYDMGHMVESYRVRRDYVMKRLDDMGLTYPQPDGAFYIFPSIEKFGLSSWEFCEQLVKAESVALIPGICFGADHHLRISYCVDQQTLEAGMDGLERFIKSLT